MVMGPRGAEAYKRTSVQSSSPLELVVMLYDGAIRFVIEAREAIARNDVRGRSSAVSRTLAIIAELQNTLNLKDGGEVGRELDRLYSYVNAKLLEVTAQGDDEAAREVQKLLTTLREGWSQIAAGGATAHR